MASVRQLTKPNREGKRPWIVDYTDAAGKRRQATPKTGLKKDADALRRKIERAIEDGRHTSRSETITIRALAEEFLRSLECRLRDGEIGHYHHDNVKAGVVHYIIPQLGPLLMTDLTAKHVRDFYEHMRRKMSAYSAKKRLTQLVLLEAFAIKREYTKAEIIKETSAEYRFNRVAVRTFTLDEIGLVLKAADDRCQTLTWASKRGGRALYMTRLFVHLAALCGLRRGEIEALTVSHVDLAARVIRVRHSMTKAGGLKGPKSKAGLRDVPMPAHVVAWVRDWLDRFHVANPTGFLFQSANGLPVRAASFNSQNWLPLLKAAGVELKGDVPHFHALRHFAASWMIENGLSITEVASLLGHAHVDMTLQVYAHPIAGGHKRVEAMDRMAASLLPASAVIDAIAGEIATQPGT